MMKSFDRNWMGIVALAGALLVAAPVLAQDDPAPPADPAPPSESAPDDSPPSLDELLGLDDEDSDDEVSPDDVADAEIDEELQRRLDEESLGNAFAVAIDKMKRCAVLLEEDFDTGLGTQRLQQEILSKLDQLIDEAKKQQQSSSSQSSSSSSSSSSEQGQKQPGKQGERQQAKPGQNQAQASDSREGATPPGRDGEINRVFDESRTEWGNLPQRIRDMLMQGRDEKFSSLYEQMTREYYRRLAEEGSS